MTEGHLKQNLLLNLISIKSTCYILPFLTICQSRLRMGLLSSLACLTEEIRIFLLKWHSLHSTCLLKLSDLDQGYG